MKGLIIGPMRKFAIVAALFSAAGISLGSLAAGLESVRLADNVVPAPFGYEEIAARYVIAEATPLYISPYVYPGTVDTMKLMPGAPVNILAKAKGYDWVLVGRNGVGIGYLPMARLAPAGANPR